MVRKVAQLIVSDIIINMLLDPQSKLVILDTQFFQLNVLLLNNEKKNQRVIVK